jgi:hypothetical protein
MIDANRFLLTRQHHRLSFYDVPAHRDACLQESRLLVDVASITDARRQVREALALCDAIKNIHMFRGVRGDRTGYPEKVAYLKVGKNRVLVMRVKCCCHAREEGELTANVANAAGIPHAIRLDRI